MNSSSSRLHASRQFQAAGIAAMIIAATLVLLSVYCRIRLLSVPLERDEGGFAYIAQQMLNGVPPFESGYSMKLMGVHAAYALFMALLGQTPTAVHFGLLLVNLGSIILLYLLARRFLPVDGAAVTAGVYGLLSASQDVLGVFAHATHFVVLFVLAGLVAFFAWREKKHSFLLLICGIFMGTATTMKQNGLFFCLLVLVMVVMELRRRKASLCSVAGKSLIWGFGAVIPYLIFLLYVTAHGVFDQFWFWTVEYALDYSSSNTITESLYYLLAKLPLVTETTFPLWCVGIAGIAAVLNKETIILDRWFIPLFSAVSFLAIIPGGYFYRHYFVLLLPAVALLVGAAFVGFEKLFIQFMSTVVAPWFALGIIVVASLAVIHDGKPYMFQLAPAEVSRLVYGDNPFAESSMGIARYIKANSFPEDKIAILGSEPQIYFYSGRQSATKHLFTYPLTEDQPISTALREEMFGEIISTVPKFIVLSLQYSSWLAVPDRIIELLAPMRAFLEENYTTIGVVDILSGEVNYYWGEDAADVEPLTIMPIFVLERIAAQSS